MISSTILYGYRNIVKKLFDDRMTKQLKEIFREIAEQCDSEIDTMEVMDDHVHLFLVVPPKYALAKVVQMIKSISTKIMF
jgi:putative transposase